MRERWPSLACGVPLPLFVVVQVMELLKIIGEEADSEEGEDDAAIIPADDTLVAEAAAAPMPQQDSPPRNAGDLGWS